MISKMFSNLFPSNKEKCIVILSHGFHDDKTKLIETLCGEKLDWHEEKIKDVYSWQIAKTKCFGKNVRIMKGQTIEDCHREVWTEIKETLEKADVILYLADLSHGISENYVDDFFEQELPEGKYLYDILKDKTLLVLTEKDQDNYLTWWDSLSQEEQERRKAENDPAYGFANDRWMCTGMWLDIQESNWESKPYDVSYYSGEGIEELRSAILAQLKKNLIYKIIMIDKFRKIAIVTKMLLRIVITALLLLSIVLIVLYSNDIYCLIVDPSICLALIFLLWNR